MGKKTHTDKNAYKVTMPNTYISQMQSWFYARKAVRQQLNEICNSLMDRMAASYELLIKHTQALDSSDRRKLQQKVELMLDKENPPVALITNMMDCCISVCDRMTLTNSV